MYEPFDYGTGEWDLETGVPAGPAGLTGNWELTERWDGSYGANPQIDSGNLSYPGLTAGEGNQLNLRATDAQGWGQPGVSFDTSDERFAAYLDSDGKIGKPGTTLWGSFLLQGQGDDMVLLKWGATWGRPYKASEFEVSGQSTGMSTSAPGTHLFLLKWTFNAGDGADTAELWIDPDLSTGTTPDSSHTYYASNTGNFEFDNLKIEVNEEKNDLTFVDEIRLGESYVDVVPEPTTMALLGIGGLGALLRRRR